VFNNLLVVFLMIAARVWLDKPKIGKYEIGVLNFSFQTRWYKRYLNLRLCLTVTVLSEFGDVTR